MDEIDIYVTNNLSLTDKKIIIHQPLKDRWILSISQGLNRKKATFFSNTLPAEALKGETSPFNAVFGLLSQIFPNFEVSLNRGEIQ